MKVELVEHLEELPIKEEAIKENVKDTNSQQSTFTCDLCDKTPDSRVIHMCPECGRQFPTKSVMQNDQIKRSDEKNFAFRECGKKFKRKKSLHFQMKKQAGK